MPSRRTLAVGTAAAAVLVGGTSVAVAGGSVSLTPSPVARMRARRITT